MGGRRGSERRRGGQVAELKTTEIGAAELFQAAGNRYLCHAANRDSMQRIASARLHGVCAGPERSNERPFIMAGGAKPRAT